MAGLFPRIGGGSLTQAPSLAQPSVVGAVAVAAVAVAGAVVLSKKLQERGARRQLEMAGPRGAYGMPSLTPPPYPGRMPAYPQGDPEVFSPGFNIHRELSTVPTLRYGDEDDSLLLNGSVKSPRSDVKVLADMYNRTYQTPEYDTNAALTMLMGHPPGQPPKKKPF